MTKLFSPLCGDYIQLSIFKERWSHLKINLALLYISQASETSHRNNSLCSFQHQYLAEILLNVRSYYLMVKTVSRYYAHERLLFSNLIARARARAHTHTHTHTHMHARTHTHTCILYCHLKCSVWRIVIKSIGNGHYESSRIMDKGSQIAVRMLMF